MGEQDKTSSNAPNERRLTVQEAAEELGISTDAVRMRLQRGTLKRERGSDGRVHVLITEDETESNDVPNNDASDVIAAKDETIRLLQEQLAEEREARRRADTILAQLARANEEQARTIRALDAPSGEAPEPQNEPESTESRSDRVAVAPPEEPERDTGRSWWRRWLGG